MRAKQIAKEFIARRCSPRLQHKIRQIYAIHQVTHGRHFREPELSLIAKLVSRGDVVADIGANVGVYTKELSMAAGPTGRVFAFEPILETYEILAGLIRKAHLHNVSAIHGALGSVAETREMVIPDMSGFTGYYWAHLAGAQDKGRRQAVQVTTLDELEINGTFHHLDFIKCDVEGAELHIIVGGLHVIQSQTPSWLIEVSKPTSREVFTTLGKIGYRAFVLNDTLTEVDSYQDGQFSNYFFLHPRSKSWARLMRP